MEDRYQEILAGLERFAAAEASGEARALVDRLRADLDRDEERLRRLVHLMKSIAALDFKERARVDDDDSLANALAAGLNMLSEHLGRVTVSTEFFASVLNTMKDGLLVVTPDGFVERTNPALLAMLGCGPTDVLGARVLELVRPAAESRPVGALLRTEADPAVLLEIDEALVGVPGGREITALVSGSKLGVSAGAGRMVLVIHDISERKQMESELKLARHKAEESARVKSAFLSNMTHEIRTPLNAIIGFTDQLLSEELPESHRRQIQTVHKSGELLLNIIGEILDISRIEVGEVDIRNEPFALDALLDNLDATGRILLTESGKAIELRRAPDTLPGLWLFGDEHRLTQIMNNMLVNAIKYTQAGSIELGVRREADRLRFFVTDTGMGIPPEEQEQVFESFRRGRSGQIKSIGGVGLGLAISRKLVRLMGGEMSLVSRVGADHGSTFFFTLPYVPARAPSANQASDPGSELRGERRRILLVEDDQDNRALATMILEKMGFLVTPAVNGLEAIKRFEELGDIDLILMDVNMPEMDGLTATREIRDREKDAEPALPIIALTAHATEEQREACLASGCDDFLTKPITRTRLMEKLKVHLPQGI